MSQNSSGKIKIVQAKERLLRESNEALLAVAIAMAAAQQAAQKTANKAQNATHGKTASTPVTKTNK